MAQPNNNNALSVALPGVLNADHNFAISRNSPKAFFIRTRGKQHQLAEISLNSSEEISERPIAQFQEIGRNIVFKYLHVIQKVEREFLVAVIQEIHENKDYEINESKYYLAVLDVDTRRDTDNVAISAEEPKDVHVLAELFLLKVEDTESAECSVEQAQQANEKGNIVVALLLSAKVHTFTVSLANLEDCTRLRNEIVLPPLNIAHSNINWRFPIVHDKAQKLRQKWNSQQDLFVELDSPIQDCSIYICNDRNIFPGVNDKCYLSAPLIIGNRVFYYVFDKKKQVGSLWFYEMNPNVEKAELIKLSIPLPKHNISGFAMMRKGIVAKDISVIWLHGNCLLGDCEHRGAHLYCLFSQYITRQICQQGLIVRNSDASNTRQALSENHKNLLTKNMSFLCHNLQNLEVIVYLCSKFQLNEPERQEVTLETKTNFKRNMELIEIICRKDEEAFEMFIESLIETNQTHILQELLEGWE